MMRLSLRPYQPTDANVITTWLKNRISYAPMVALTDMSVTRSHQKI